MPATAGRVRMPANNRVHSSAALQTHGIWQSAIGYDPYAPTNKDDSNKKSAKTVAAAEPEGENAYASFQGLLQLAKITNSNLDEARGACKKCGRVGHLTFQCRNFLSVRDDVKKEGKDDVLIREVLLEKLKGEKVKLNGDIKDKVEGGGESSEEEEEESEISDSDYDSEIERIIAKKYGKKGNCKRKDDEGDDDKEEEEDEEDEDEGKKRKKRGRSKKRSSRKMESSESEDADEGGRGRRRKERKEKRCRRDDDSSSSDDGEEQRRKRKTRQEKRRRRSHRHSSEDSSEESPERGHTHKRRSRRVSSPSDSDVSVSDDSRVGRYKKRDDKTSKKRHREREN